MVPISRDDAHVDPYETFRFPADVERSLRGRLQGGERPQARTEVVTNREIVGREAGEKTFATPITRQWCWNTESPTTWSG